MYPRPNVGEFVQRLELRINISFDDCWTLREGLDMPWMTGRDAYALEATHGWGYLLINRKSIEWHRSARWQTWFPRIRQLNLVFCGDCADTPICFKKDQMQIFLNQLSQLGLPLCTKELEVELRGIYCSANGPYKGGCHGPCEDDLKRIITDMVALREPAVKEPRFSWQ